MLEEKDSHEGPIRFLAMFQHAVQPPMVVEPTERPFHLPPLAAIAPVMDIFRRAAARNSDRVLAIGGDGYKATLAQGTAMRFAIVAFVQPQVLGLRLRLPMRIPLIVSNNLMRSLRFALLRAKLRGWPLASMTRWRFSPLIRCFPEYRTSGFAPF